MRHGGRRDRRRKRWFSGQNGDRILDEHQIRSNVNDETGLEPTTPAPFRRVG